MANPDPEWRAPSECTPSVYLLSLLLVYPRPSRKRGVMGPEGKAIIADCQSTYERPLPFRWRPILAGVRRANDWVSTGYALSTVLSAHHAGDGQDGF